jgi:hypothetical protein
MIQSFILFRTDDKTTEIQWRRVIDTLPTEESPYDTTNSSAAIKIPLFKNPEIPSHVQKGSSGVPHHTTNSSAAIKIPHFKNPEIPSHVQKGSSGVPHHRPIHLAHALPPYLFNINFNVIVLSTSTFPEQNSVLFSFLLCHGST